MVKTLSQRTHHIESPTLLLFDFTARTMHCIACKKAFTIGLAQQLKEQLKIYIQ